MSVTLNFDSVVLCFALALGVGECSLSSIGSGSGLQFIPLQRHINRIRHNAERGNRDY